MPRGGRRSGAPGTAYSNRTDLNVPAAAASGQTYGKRSKQMAAQRALPMARPATDAVPVASPQAATPAPQGPPAPAVMPGQVVPLTAPSQRPDEPVTAGLPLGAGAGPEALGPLAGASNDVAMELRAIYARFPNEDIRSLLELLDD
jgi:hypothetical protein